MSARSVLMAAAACVVLACVPAGVQPAEVRDRAALRSCGEEDRLKPLTPANTEARECLLRAFETRQGAELVAHRSTIEGAPTTTYYRVWPEPGVPVQVFVDTSRDPMSATAWARYRCETLLEVAGDLVFETRVCGVAIRIR